MLINVIARGGDVVRRTSARSSSTTTSRAPRRSSSRAARSAIFRTLRDAGVVEIARRIGAGPRSPILRLTVDLQPNFALNQPLSPFALAAIELLDPDDAPERRSAPATTRSTS